jgi:pyruvate dehydrogenase complex dehydrogenase (E1) component
MSTLNRMLTMILRGRNDQFNVVLQEELKERASILMEKVYQEQTKDIIKTIKTFKSIDESESIFAVSVSVPFSNLLQLRDGNNVELTSEQFENISKLYKSLNNDSKERLVKLLSESQMSVNKIINLAKNSRN